jgi:P pilus assembly chaperone PapD
MPYFRLYHISRLFFNLFILIICTLNASAQGDLLVMPKRLMFDGSKRSEKLNLANTGKDSATYVISIVQIRMKEDGSFEQITQPDSNQLFADKYLRFFPRTVTLAPNEAQTVRVQVTKANEMMPGEYRSHLYLRSVPKEQPLGESGVKNDSGISIKLIPVFGISIPVIIRNSEGSAQLNISDVAFKMENDSMPAVKMNFNRSGNNSVYGDVTVDHISSIGKVTRVGVVKGLAVYTPNARRIFNILLNKNETVNYHSGKLKIMYTDQAVKPTVLAEKEVELK